MGYIAVDPNDVLTLLDAGQNPVNPPVITFRQDAATGLYISDPFYLQPALIEVPDGNVFVSFDYTLAVSPAYTATFRIGNDPAQGAALPTGHTWHDQPDYQHFLMYVQLCTIGPVAFPIMDLQAAILTTEDTGTAAAGNQPGGPYQFNLNFV
ncbi:MAG: hypothetical protein V4577_04455 [Bacteroidota bacterium]